MSERYDTVFSLPSVDDDPDTEVGVLLLGLAPDRLLAGLGVATRDPVADPATVTLLVDQLRHDARPGFTFSDAVAAGAQRWRVAREGYVDLGSGTRSAALRQVWESAARALAAAAAEFPQVRTNGAAERVYLTACWSRLDEITKIAEERCPI